MTNLILLIACAYILITFFTTFFIKKYYGIEERWLIILLAIVWPITWILSFFSFSFCWLVGHMFNKVRGV